MVARLGLGAHAAFHPSQGIAQVQRACGARARSQAVKGRARLHERRHQAAALRVEDRHTKHLVCTQRGQMRTILTDRQHDRRRLETTLHDKARQKAARHAVELARNDVETCWNTPKGAG